VADCVNRPGIKTTGDDPAWYGQPALARINATSPELLRAFAKLNAGRVYADQVKPFNFLSFAPGTQPPADQNPAYFRLVAPYGTAAERRKALWVKVHEPDETYRLHTDPTRPGTAITDSHRLHALRYFSHAESKSADEHGNPCGRGTRGLLQRRHVNAGLIAHIGKEANLLEQRQSGELTADDANDAHLEYRDPSVDTWRTDDLPRLKQIPLKEMAALAGLSERRLRDIYAGRSTPRLKTRLRIQALLLKQAYASVGN
jgi:hypothetical protein